MLHSFGLLFKPWTDYAQFIRSEITRNAQRSVDFHDHSLLNARLNDDTSEVPFVGYLNALYSANPPHLILAIGAPAANFVQRHRQRIFPGTPMLFTAVEARRVQYDKLTEDDTVVAVAHDFPASFENILRVLPRTKMIAIVNGASPNETFWLGELRRETAPLTGWVELKFYNEFSFADILKDAANLPPHSAIFWHLMNVDAAGVAHEANAALRQLSATANAPVFTYLDIFFGDDTTVGGPMHSVEEGSTVAAAVAVRILNGEKAGDIKTAPTRYALPKFDWRQMQRWGISESNLPPGSEILFRPPTVWEQYRPHILAIFAGFLVQGAMITWLIYEHWRRHNAEVKVRTALAELAHMNRAATVGEMTASIAHEMRQPLAAVAVAGQTALNWLKRRVPDLEEAKAAMQNVIQEVHRADDVIKNIRAMFKKEEVPRTTVDVNELIEQVLILAKPTIDSNHIVLETNLMGSPRPLVLGDVIQLQQVLLNLINNAVEAMGSSDRTRVLQVKTDTSSIQVVRITVADSGPGIDPTIADKLFEPFVTTKSDGMGMGLSICKSIIEAHGGKLTAGPAKPFGALFVISLPIWQP
jgi:signal transduction histidine kinase